MRFTLRTAGRRFGDHLLDLALPARCAGCGTEGDPLCGLCARGLTGRTGLPAGVSLGLPSEVPLPLAQLEWCTAFRGVTRAALHALKYGGDRRMARPLGRAAAARWREAGIGGDVLVPVPVHKDRARQRGYDQAVLLGRVCSEELGIPLGMWLERRRATRAQFDLGRAERLTNVDGAFELGADADGLPLGRWPVLVDDVVTTGATLVACAEVLLEAGARGVSALAVAREG